MSATLPATAQLSVTSTPENDDYLHVNVTLRGEKKQTNLKALIDSGATMNFLSKEFAEEQKIRLYEYEKLIPLFNVDGTRNQAGDLTHYAKLWIRVGKHEAKERIPVTNTGIETLIMGYEWLERHNPEINWRSGDIGFT